MKTSNNILFSEKLLEIDTYTLYNSLKVFEFSKMYEFKLNDGIYIVDFRCTIECHKEKEYFEKYPNLKKYFTRGLAFLNKNGEISILRKGLTKFFNYENDFNLNLNKNHSLLIMNKEDGMNVQFTYEEKINSLIISTKNVTIACNKIEDLDKYINLNMDRYLLCYLIAKLFFNKYEITNDLINILKEYILVGEYIGNTDKLLVNYYNIETLKFFTLVKKNDYINEKPIEYLNTIKSLNLDLIDYQYIENITNNDFDNKVEEIKNGSLIEVGEGKVLYLLENNELINMFKIKSKEYFILFYLKKNYFKKDLIKINKIYPQSYEFYENMIDEYYKIDLEKYAISNYFSLILINIYQKIKDSFKINLKEENLFIFKNMKQINTFKNKINKNKEVVLLMPTGLKCCGKTYLGKNILKDFLYERGFDYEIISYELIFEKLINENKIKYPDLSEEDIKKLSKNECLNRFDNELIKIITEYNNNDKILFIYLDRNHLKKELDSVFDLKKKFEFIEIISLTNKYQLKNKINIEGFNLPFDYNNLINVINRIINNNEYNNSIELIKKVFKNLILFNNFEVKNIYKNYKIQFFDIKLIKNNFKSIKNYENIIKLINLILKNFDNNGINNNYIKLIEEIKIENLKEISKNNIIKNMNENFYQFILKFIFGKVTINKENKNKITISKYGIILNTKIDVLELLKKNDIVLNSDDSYNFKRFNHFYVPFNFFKKKSKINNNYELDKKITINANNLIYIENLCVFIDINIDEDERKKNKIKNKYLYVTLMISEDNFKEIECNSILKILKENKDTNQIIHRNKKYNIFIKKIDFFIEGKTGFIN